MKSHATVNQAHARLFKKEDGGNLEKKEVSKVCSNRMDSLIGYDKTLPIDLNGSYVF